VAGAGDIAAVGPVVVLVARTTIPDTGGGADSGTGTTGTGGGADSGTGTTGTGGGGRNGTGTTGSRSRKHGSPGGGHTGARAIRKPERIHHMRRKEADQRRVPVLELLVRQVTGESRHGRHGVGDPRHPGDELRDLVRSDMVHGPDLLMNQPHALTGGSGRKMHQAEAAPGDLDGDGVPDLLHILNVLPLGGHDAAGVIENLILLIHC
jgi:hypothetical protein